MTNDPQEIGEMVAFLLRDRAVALRGATMLVGGGVTAMLVSKEPLARTALEG